MKVDKLYIYTCESFPFGMAATNRIIAYGKGFAHHGKDVEIICCRKTEVPGNVLNHQVRGSYQGLKFRYLSRSTVRSGNVVRRQLDKIVTYARLAKLSLVELNRDSVIIYYYVPSTFFLLLVKAVARLKGVKVYLEMSEHPDVYIKGRMFLSKLMIRNVHPRLFDGVFLMTASLVEHFLALKVPRKSILHVPMTVETERFKDIIPTGTESKEIIYTGMLDDAKDGTDVLIKAFAKLVATHPDYVLSLYGAASSSEDEMRYRRMIQDLGISTNVQFHGRVSRDEITRSLARAAILVLPRPDSLQARNGFPTKLGEYLATGVPVIATSVGEIPDYLADNETAFLAVPGSVDSLVEKFSRVISDYSHALEVAGRGKQVAENNFSNITQTARIISFVENRAG